MCRTPVLQTVKKAAAGSRRSLADTTSPLSQQAAATAAALDRMPRTRELKPSGKNKYMVMDGNEAAAYIAYSMSDISFIYPISPATSMGEHMDKWAASGKKNILGQVCLHRRTRTHVRLRYMLSSLSSVCLSAMLMHPTQAVEIFGNISTSFATLAMH